MYNDISSRKNYNIADSLIGACTKRIGELYMFVREVMVKNQVGLHARPATFFIQKANEFKSSIWIEKEERRVNAKSLLGIQIGRAHD